MSAISIMNQIMHLNHAVRGMSPYQVCMQVRFLILFQVSAMASRKKISSRGLNTGTICAHKPGQHI